MWGLNRFLRRVVLHRFLFLHTHFLSHLFFPPLCIISFFVSFLPSTLIVALGAEDMIHGWQTKKAVVPSTIASWLWGIVPTCLFSMGAGN
ncbi:hypothetical protein B0O80DRAFT_463037 [Mortierella sp. GBAus27b]|nr:hypothetical protein B0O80DRAFT_463037 [Mortierella sp. GBAus27b]